MNPDTRLADKFRSDNFLCRCGNSLTYEVNGDNRVRVNCSRMSFRQGRRHDSPGIHTPPTDWCDTREDAEQLWRVTQLLQHP